MDRFGAIWSSISIPRLLVGAVLLGSIWMLAMAFARFGLPAGVALAFIPGMLCMVWFSLHNPVLGMMGMFIGNYFIMVLTRYAHDLPFGLILDALVFYNLLILLAYAAVHKIEWRRARTGLTLVASIWLIYCILQLLNPGMTSPAGWVTSFRSVSLFFFLIVVLTQIQLAEFKYLKYILIIWSVLTLFAVAKACSQKFGGFNTAENYWLFVMGARSTHIIRSGVRYFSFFSDAANFGGSMGMSLVVFSISALYFRNKWMKFYLLFVAAAACYGMLISGTRSALAVPFVGFAVFVVLSKNIKMIAIGLVLVIGMFLFLNFTTIGHGNPLIRRARSAFNTEDASFQVRLRNQAQLRQIMADKPFGVGLGNSGTRGSELAPNSPVANIPTDSWFVKIWVETGVVGIVLHAMTLLYILLWGGYQVAFRLRNDQVRGLTAALICGVSGIVIMSIANEVLGQIPTGLIVYMSAAFIFLSPRFDAQMCESDPAQPLKPTPR